MQKETVVLLHGIFRGRLDMWPLAKYLEFRGYNVLNIAYPARKRRLEELSIILNHKIHSHPKYNPDARLNFVGHSLGAVLIRYYIRDFSPENIGRVVMLGPPNKGSEWADYMFKSRWFGFLYRTAFGPVGEQLMTTHIHDDGDADYDLGIIAGSKNAVPFAKYIMKGTHDGMVSVDSTKLPHMSAHMISDTSHTYMITKPGVMRQVAAFLKNSRFI